MFWNKSNNEGMKDFVSIVRAVSGGKEGRIRTLGYVDHQGTNDISIGNDKVSQNPTRFASEFRELGKYLTNDGQFQFWGCRVAGSYFRDFFRGITMKFEPVTRSRKKLKQMATWLGPERSIHANKDYQEFGEDKLHPTGSLLPSHSDAYLDWSTNGSRPLPVFEQTAHQYIPALPPVDPNTSIENEANRASSQYSSVPPQPPIDASTSIEQDAKKAAQQYSRAYKRDEEAKQGGKQYKDAVAAQEAGQMYASRTKLRDKCKDLDEALRQEIQNCKKCYNAGWDANNNGDSYTCGAKQTELENSKTRVYALFEQFRSECGGIELGEEQYGDAIFESQRRGEIVREAAQLQLKCSEQPSESVGSQDPCAGCRPYRCPGPTDPRQSPDGRWEIRSDRNEVGCCLCPR